MCFEGVLSYGAPSKCFQLRMLDEGRSERQRGRLGVRFKENSVQDCICVLLNSTRHPSQPGRRDESARDPFTRPMKPVRESSQCDARQRRVNKTRWRETCRRHGSYRDRSSV